MFSIDHQKRKEMQEMIQKCAEEASIKNKLENNMLNIYSKCPQQRFEGLDRILRYGKNYPHILLEFQEKIKECLLKEEEDRDVKIKARQILEINNYYEDPLIIKKKDIIEKNNQVCIDDLLHNAFIRIPGNTFQEKLDTLDKCKCCARHQYLKPVKFCEYIELKSNYKIDQDKKCECECDCRHIARFICRQYPREFYQPVEEKRVEITDQLQVAYTAKEFEEKYGEDWYEKWKLAITQLRSPPGLEEDHTFWDKFQFYEVYGNLKEWESAMPRMLYGEDDFQKWLEIKRLNEIENKDQIN